MTSNIRYGRRVSPQEAGEGWAQGLCHKDDHQGGELLSKPEVLDPLALKQLGMCSREKLEVIKTLDGEILELVKEDDLANEIDQADLYKENIYSTLIKIDGAVAAVEKPMSATKETVVAATPEYSTPCAHTQGQTT